MYESGHIKEIIAVIRVAHDDVFAPRRFDPPHQGVPISPFFHGDHPGAEALRNFDGTVGAAVIRHDQLTIDSRLADAPRSLAQTRAKGIRLVEAWNHNGELNCFPFLR